MTDSPFWLAIGAFLVSPGFGALAAVLAAFLAYAGIGRQLLGERALAEQKASNDRETALEGDRRRRWWTVLTWLWDNRDELSEAELLEGLIALKSPELTAEQATMLQVVTEAAVLNKAVPETEALAAPPAPARDATRNHASQLIVELGQVKDSLPHGL